MRHGRLITTAIAAVAAMAIGPAGALAAPATFTDEDFAGGSATAPAAVAAGSVQLTRGTVTEEWNGPTLPTSWTASQYVVGGSASLAVPGTLEIDGAHVDSTRTFSTADGTQVLQWTGEFAGEANQHVGFANLGADGPWAIFSTQNGGDLVARTRTAAGGADAASTLMSTALGASFHATDPHTYRIEWSATDVKYYVLDVSATPVATHPFGVAGSLPVVMSDLTPSGAGPVATLRIDSLSQNLYPSPGTFESRVFDAGNVNAVWGALTPAVAAPAGTSVAFETRSSTDGTTFSGYQPVVNGAIQSPKGRFIQYRATLSAADNRFTPSFDSVQIAYDIANPATGGGGSGGSGSGSGSGGSGTSGGGNSATDKTAPKVAFAAKSLRASKKGTVSFTVGCPGTESSCTVKVTLKNGKKSVASKTVTVKGGKTKTVTLTLSSAAKKLLAKRHSLKVSSVVTASDAAGNHRTTTKTFTLRRAG
jgi:hypothetical protein